LWLTFKSTDAILAKANAAGVLVRFQPELDPDQGDPREIWMPPALHSWLYQKDSRQSRDFKASVRAHLIKFIIDDPEQPIDNEDYMKNWPNSICPDFFEIRYQVCPDHKDNTRIFGGFIKQDCLVLFHQKLRREIKGDADWNKALTKLKNKWDKALPTAHMVRARPFSNCVSGSFDDVHN
jgi:hypothetical protein